jgi:glycosyltransferase involved in cell wall biosynthesis
VTEAPVFTVFTPTYNRAHTIGRVFESLRAQTFRDFEWLVVDDGSTDGTVALLVQWSASADFPIKVLSQKNSGKHVAFNRAVEEARGRYFVPLDSDDGCLPLALERFAHHWNAIPEESRDSFSGVCVLCQDQQGRIVGDRFPIDKMDADSRQLAYVLKVGGEKWGFHRTDILRMHPFPELVGTRFVPELVLWHAIAKTHRLRCVNEALRIYYVGLPENGASLSASLRSFADAAGRLYYCGWLLDNDLTYFSRRPLPFIKAATQFPVFALVTGQGRAAWSSLESVWARLLVVLCLPAAVLFYAQVRLSRGSR